MDHVHQSQSFTAQEIQAINLVRLYLQVTTVSDISNANGTRIQAAARMGNSQQFSSYANWLYPVQTQPDHNSWQVWRQALLLFSNSDGELLVPLGC